MVLTRAAQLVPQQEPGWGRVHPLAPGLAGGNKMFPTGRAGWEELVLGWEPWPCCWHLAGCARMGSGSIVGSLWSLGVCTGLSPMPWDIVSPVPGLLSLPRVAAGSRASLRSPPQQRQQLSRTLFWMFMGFQFTPGSEAAKPPSQGASNPPRPARGPCLPAEEGFQSLAGLSSWLRNSAFVRGLLPRLKNLQQIKILMGTYSIL